MKAYIITLIVCEILAIVADGLFKAKHKKIGFITLAAIVFVASFIAGIRSEEVGYDIHNYVTSLLEDFMHGGTVLSDYSKFGIEPGFTCLVAIVSVFRNLGVVLFTIQLACILPIIVYAYKNREKCPIALTVLIFFSTMYCFSFNMMRQSIAIALGLLATYYFANNDAKKGFVVIAVAFLFHRTALVLVAIFLIRRIINEKKKDKQLRLLIFVVLSIAIAALSPQLIAFLPVKYSSYLGDMRFTSSINVLSIMKKIIWLFPIAICLHSSKNDENNRNELLFATILVILDLVTYFIGIKVPTVSRLSLYFSYIAYFVFIPIIVRIARPRLISTGLIAVALLGLWAHMTVTDESAHIYPYKTDAYNFLNSVNEE